MERVSIYVLEPRLLSIKLDEIVQSSTEQTPNSRYHTPGLVLRYHM